MEKNLCTLLFIILFIFSQSILIAQKEQVDFGSRIGMRMDNIERNYFNFLPKHNDFNYAEVFRNNDIGFDIIVNKGDGSKAIIPIDKDVFENLKLYFDKFEQLFLIDTSIINEEKSITLVNYVRFKMKYLKNSELKIRLYNDSNIEGEALYFDNENIVLWKNSEIPYTWNQLNENAIMINYREIATIDGDTVFQEKAIWEKFVDQNKEKISFINKIGNDFELPQELITFIEQQKEIKQNQNIPLMTEEQKVKLRYWYIGFGQDIKESIPGIIPDFIPSRNNLLTVGISFFNNQLHESNTMYVYTYDNKFSEKIIQEINLVPPDLIYFLNVNFQVHDLLILGIRYCYLLKFGATQLNTPKLYGSILEPYLKFVILHPDTSISNFFDNIYRRIGINAMIGLHSQKISFGDLKGTYFDIDYNDYPLKINEDQNELFGGYFFGGEILYHISHSISVNFSIDYKILSHVENPISPLKWNNSYGKEYYQEVENPTFELSYISFGFGVNLHLFPNKTLF